MGFLRLFFKIEDKVTWALAFIPALATRILVGYGFYLTGFGKLGRIDDIVDWFRELGIPRPEIQAPFVANLEYWGGLLLMAGLCTRVVAALLSGSMAVALLTADKQGFLESWLPTSEQLPVDITSFTYLVFLLWLVVYGAGVLSADYPLGWVLRRAARREPGSGVVVIEHESAAETA